ncbi:preprotein translocase subunit SecG [Candidatus Dependentiae bacterium]|nr:preprotein translocase subunit SecG [Candidatus Dependentiae bacterium]
MLYGFLLTLLIIDAILLVPIILIQQSKGSIGLGSLGGGAQMLFGGSGGQDIFQKITWILGGTFMGLALLLALMKTNYVAESRYLKQITQTAQQQVQKAQQLPERVEEPVEPATAE